MKLILNKSKRMLEVENTLDTSLEEHLRKLYVDENKPTRQIAKELNINYKSAYYWLKRSGIYSKKLVL